MTARELLERLWDSYVAIAPQATAVHELLRARGDHVANDHIALRTFGREPIALDAMARPFVDLGWQGRDRYVFPDKKLRARYFQHAEESLPKVFISELDVDALGHPCADVIDSLVAAVPAGLTEQADWVARGRVWPLTLAQHATLAEASDYAGWVAVHGFRANHFTVDVSRLGSVGDIEELTRVLSAAGFPLNDAGGVVKGGREVYLAQASTRAEEMEVALADGVVRVPTCYVEFAQRFAMPSGEIYQGFIAASADKIFESTDR